MELQQKLVQSGGFSHAIGHVMVLSLYTRMRDYVLPLGGPGDHIVTEEDCVTGGGAPGVGTASPISIGVHCQVRTLRRLKQKAHMQCAMDIARMRLREARCGSQGSCKKRQTCWTTCARIGRVKVSH